MLRILTDHLAQKTKLFQISVLLRYVALIATTQPMVTAHNDQRDPTQPRNQSKIMPRPNTIKASSLRIRSSLVLMQASLWNLKKMTLQARSMVHVEAECLGQTKHL